MCGETLCQKLDQMLLRGLSPRVRGNLPPPIRLYVGRGSIPACAGKPRNRSLQAPLRRVYPRVCGETELLRRRGPGPWGLSPRVRGNQKAPVLALGNGGSIPACAGKPRGGTAVKISGPVYPRVCGETGSKSGCVCAHLGLSPRVRGNLYHIWKMNERHRSIPACAGKPASTH